MKVNYVDDIQFVLDEVARIAKKDLRTVIKEMDFPDHLAMLPHPDGRGQMLCGMAAYNRIRKMAETGLSRSVHVGRIDINSIFEALKKIIVQRFLVERRLVNRQECDKAISSAIAEAAINLSTIKHYIPCHLGHIKTPESFVIGPVHFKQTETSLNHLEGSFETYLKKSENIQLPNGNVENRRNITSKLLEDTKRYYNSFGWIAEVTVENCSPDISKKTALHLTSSALNSVHLLIGADYSRHMRVGGIGFSTDKRGHIHIDTNLSDLEISTSTDWLSHHLGEDWWEKINEKGYDYLIYLIGIAIEKANDPSKSFPLSQRFLDALSWFGEAVRDQFPASSLIKYVTAMERILTTKNENNLVNTIAIRGAALIVDTQDDNWPTLVKRFKSVYNLRSRLVHGSRSPHEKGLYTGLKDAEWLARYVLFQSLEFFGKDGLCKEEISTKRIDENYEKIIQMAGYTTNTPIKSFLSRTFKYWKKFLEKVLHV